MRKEYYFYIAIVIFIITGIIYYHRPLNLQWLTDPGEAYFELPKRLLPSSLSMVNAEYGVDRPKSTPEMEKLNSIDKELQDYNVKWEPNHTYLKRNASGTIEELYHTPIVALLDSGDNRETIQYHLNNFNTYLSGYEYYPTQLTWAGIIPRANGIQSIYRVGSLYATSLCLEGHIDPCTSTFKTLIDFSQQIKNGWSLVSLLIGLVVEGITIEKIEYLNTLDPVLYQPLITTLQSTTYIDPDTGIRTAMSIEYQTFVNEIKNIKKDNSLPLFDTYNHVSGGWEWEYLIDTIFYKLASWIPLPAQWFLNLEETIALWRMFYYQAIETDMITPEEYNSAYPLSPYRPWPMISRPNFMGRWLMNALIPRLTGIQSRAIDHETRFNNLINP